MSKQPDKSGKPRIATLSSLRESSQQPPHQQAYYAGGSDGGSGQQVLGPSAIGPGALGPGAADIEPNPGTSGRRDPESIVSEMFRSARAHGGETVEPGASGSGVRRNPSNAFGGIGRRLGSNEGSSETTPTNPNQPVTLGMVQAALAAARASDGAQGGSQENESDDFSDFSDDEPQEMVIRFWRNGFSVDDGPLRSYDDPANNEFLGSIRRGDVPRELFTTPWGLGEINLNMEDHKNEDYVQIKKPIKAFTGKGRRLGSVVPPTSVAAPSDTSNLPPRDLKSAETEAQEALQLNTNEPHTNIQIRLADSSRIVMRINTNQPVSRIREFICRARPGTLSDSFKLLTTFPSKELSDEDQTIADAQLANATVVQRMI